MRILFPLIASCFIAACATTAAPPTPPVPVTSHAVTAADYPRESVTLRETGITQVQYLVLTDGSVGRIIVAASSGYPRLDNAAQELVNRWRFEPATMNGRPVPAWLNANVAFVLR